MVGTLPLPRRTTTLPIADKGTTPLSAFPKTRYQATSQMLVEQSQSLTRRVVGLKEQTLLDRRCEEVAELIEQQAQNLIRDYQYGKIDLKTFKERKTQILGTAAAIGLSLLILTNFNPKVQVRDRVTSTFTPQPKTEVVTTPTNLAQPSADRVTPLMHAIIGQESSGRFNLVNADSGALGYGQVIPENVPSWTKEALGYSLSPKQFLNAPELQLKTIKYQLQKAINSQARLGRSEEETIRRVASIWYSGKSQLWNNTKPQYSGGNRYPSIEEYTRSVWGRYQTELAKQPKSAPQVPAAMKRRGWLKQASAAEITQSSALRVVENALTWVGKEYKPGQSARCADFVRHILKVSGLNVPVSQNPIDKDKQGDARSPLMAQSFFGDDVGQLIYNKSELKPGDLVAFFDTYGSNPKGTITHVGIYVGNGMMVDRATRSKPVFKRSISRFKFAAGVRPYAYQ